jgi:xanthine dehydrogenase accessory factor
VEPAPDIALLKILAQRLAAGQLVLRTVETGSTKTELHSGCSGDQLCWDGQTLTTLHGPAWRLLIIGAG